jgi:hypothetical protein
VTRTHERFLRGLLSEPERLALIDQQYQSVPLQVEARDRWSDRSLKWGLLHFRATIAAWQAIAYRLHYPSDDLRPPDARRFLDAR